MNRKTLTLGLIGLLGITIETKAFDFELKEEGHIIPDTKSMYNLAAIEVELKESVVLKTSSFLYKNSIIDVLSIGGHAVYYKIEELDTKNIVIIKDTDCDGIFEALYELRYDEKEFIDVLEEIPTCYFDKK